MQFSFREKQKYKHRYFCNHRNVNNNKKIKTKQITDLVKDTTRK